MIIFRCITLLDCHIQDRLLQKLGASAHAFRFQLPTTAPVSIILQDGNDDTKSPVGVEYDFVTYVGENAEDRAHKRSTVSMAIRKVRKFFFLIIVALDAFQHY